MPLRTYSLQKSAGTILKKTAPALKPAPPPSAAAVAKASTPKRVLNVMNVAAARNLVTAAALGNQSAKNQISDAIGAARSGDSASIGAADEMTAAQKIVELAFYINRWVYAFPATLRALGVSVS